MSFHFENFIIGENNEDIHLATREENQVATRTLASQAGKSMHLFSYQLNSALYDDTSFLESIRQLAIRSKYTKIQILVVDTQPMIKQGHRIIETARRISSSIEIRKVCDEFKNKSNAFFIVDETALITRKLATRYEAILNFSNATEARVHLNLFNEIWRRSSPEPMMKHLNI